MTAIARSSRLLLRPPEPRDVEPLSAMWSDPETMRYIGKGVPWTRDEVAARVERGALAHAKLGMCFWTVVRAEDDAVLGQCGVVPIDFNGPEHELGYRFGRDHWGKGYATEAAALAASHAFGPLGLARLVAVTYPENTPSRRVLTKAGFRETGESDKYYAVHAITFEMTPADLPRSRGNTPDRT